MQEARLAWTLLQILQLSEGGESKEKKTSPQKKDRDGTHEQKEGERVKEEIGVNCPTGEVEQV